METQKSAVEPRLTIQRGAENQLHGIAWLIWNPLLVATDGGAYSLSTPQKLKFDYSRSLASARRPWLNRIVA